LKMRNECGNPQEIAGRLGRLNEELVRILSHQCVNYVGSAIGRTA
jgi:hypothetical protein